MQPTLMCHIKEFLIDNWEKQSSISILGCNSGVFKKQIRVILNSKFCLENNFTVITNNVSSVLMGEKSVMDAGYFLAHETKPILYLR